MEHGASISRLSEHLTSSTPWISSKSSAATAYQPIGFLKGVILIHKEAQ
jgi:hypothetical protein